MRIYLIPLFILILSYSGITKLLQMSFFSFASPLILNLKESSIKVQEIFVLFSNIDEIRKENSRLKKIITLSDLEDTKKRLELLNNNEITTLKQSFKNSNLLRDREISIKKVIYYDSFGSRIFLDNSESELFKEGSLVLIGENLIGLVKIGDSKIIEVRLVSNKDLVINTNIINKDLFKIKTVLDSESGDSLIINNILATEEVKEGDLVVTSNTNENILPDLIIGNIQRIEGISSQTFRKAYLSKFYDLHNTNFVGVVKK